MAGVVAGGLDGLRGWSSAPDPNHAPTRRSVLVPIISSAAPRDLERIPMRLALIWIAAVSALDAAYCVHDGYGFVSDELNPLVVWVVEQAGIAGLVGAKVIGTSLVLMTLYELWFVRYRHRWIVVTVLCMVQLAVVLSYIPRWW